MSLYRNPKISDKLFKELVSLLDNYQGPMIRKISSALSPFVMQLVGGRFETLKITSLMNVDIDELLQYPKGSDCLLQILTPLV